jgi:hypothetical protein
MINAISSAAQIKSTAASANPTPPPTNAAVSTPKPAAPQAPASQAVADTVQISNAARALQEAIETPAQTAKEASRGDRQAQKLLAREAAAHKTE